MVCFISGDVVRGLGLSLSSDLTTASNVHIVTLNF